MSEPFKIPFTSIPGKVNLDELLKLERKETFLSIFCHAIGTVQSFNSDKQTVSATINYKQTLIRLDPSSGTYVPVLLDYPVLVDCPAIFLGGGDCSQTFPVKKGDECLVLFNDRDIDGWFSGSVNNPPPTPRAHSISDGIIIVGIRSLGNVLKNFDTERAVLRNGTTLVGVGPSLIKLANNQHTFNNLMQELVSDVKDLVSAVQALTVTCAAPGSPSGPPLNASAISAVTTSLTQTAQKISELFE